MGTYRLQLRNTGRAGASLPKLTLQLFRALELWGEREPGCTVLTEDRLSLFSQTPACHHVHTQTCIEHFEPDSILCGFMCFPLGLASCLSPFVDLMSETERDRACDAHASACHSVGVNLACLRCSQMLYAYIHAASSPCAHPKKQSAF